MFMAVRNKVILCLIFFIGISRLFFIINIIVPGTSAVFIIVIHVFSTCTLFIIVIFLIVIILFWKDLDNIFAFLVK